MRIERRSLTLSEAVASVLSGEVVSDVYDVEHDECDDARGVSALAFKLTVKRRPRYSPLKCTGPKVEDACPQTRPSETPIVDWVHEALFRCGAVLAAAPVTRKVLMLSKSVACGHPQYWLENMADSTYAFNQKKARRPDSPNRMMFEANMLSDGVERFIPEGDAYGLSVAEMDAYLDAGVSVEIRKRPYGLDERISFAEAGRQSSCCAKEVAMLLDAAKREIAPCVVAIFYARSGLRSEWPTGPMNKVEESVDVNGDVSALVTVSQISTFNLGCLMDAINAAPVETRRDHLTKVLLEACPSVFSKVRELVTPHKGFSTVKLNMTPASVVFCPELADSGGSWTLGGTGFMPVSRDYLDGVPRLTDFNSVVTVRVGERSASPVCTVHSNPANLHTPALCW